MWEAKKRKKNFHMTWNWKLLNYVSIFPRFHRITIIMYFYCKGTILNPHIWMRNGNIDYIVNFVSLSVEWASKHDIAFTVLAFSCVYIQIKFTVLRLFPFPKPHCNICEYILVEFQEIILDNDVENWEIKRRFRHIAEYLHIQNEFLKFLALKDKGSAKIFLIIKFLR